MFLFGLIDWFNLRSELSLEIIKNSLPELKEENEGMNWKDRIVFNN